MIRPFKKIYNELINSTYFKNLLLLTSGVGFSQLIPLLLLPILTRFFSPYDFGILAIFLALIQLIAIVGTFRLEMAVVLPKKDTDAAILCLLAFFALSLISCIVLLLAFVSWELFFSKLISPLYKDLLGGNNNMINGSYFPFVFYLIPLGAFFLGCYNILYSWNNRLELYKDMSYSHIIHSAFSTPLAIIFYFSPFKLFALLLSQVIARIMACFLLLKSLISTVRLISSDVFYNNYRSLIRNYRQFVFFETPHSIINFFSQKMILGAFTTLFGVFTVGVFDLADKILAKPLGIISNSFKTVFYKRLTTAKNKILIFKKSIFLMTVISLLLTFPFYLMPDSFFVFVLGPEWGDTGRYIKLLCPLLFSRFIFNVITPTLSYTLQNHYLLIWQVLYFILLAILFFILRNQVVEDFLLIYALFGAFMYAFLGLISFLVLKKNNL